MNPRLRAEALKMQPQDETRSHRNTNVDDHLWINTQRNLERNLLQGITKAMTKTSLRAWLNSVNEAISYAIRKLYPKEYW